MRKKDNKKKSRGREKAVEKKGWETPGSMIYDPAFAPSTNKGLVCYEYTVLGFFFDDHHHVGL